MSTDRLATAVRELLSAASEPITYPASPGSDALVLVPATYLDMLRTALVPEPAPTPFVVIDPRMKFGQPCIRGHRITAHQIAEMYWFHGESLESEILNEFDLTRADVLACCFYVANYGTRKQRKRWKNWLAGVWASTGQDRDTLVNSGWWSEGWSDVPLPPTEKESA